MAVLRKQGGHFRFHLHVAPDAVFSARDDNATDQNAERFAGASYHR